MSHSAPGSAPSRPAPLIVLEGIDGSGKGTQAARLHARLQADHRDSQLLSFPRYRETFFGARIGEFLDGRFGPLDSLDPFLISLLYAGDRFESRSLLAEARATREVIVLDRYVPSNLAHQSAKRSGGERVQLREWIEHVEYGLFDLPRPDQVILLDIPVDASQELIARKNQRTYTDRKADLQEADVCYLEQVRSAYLELASGEASWNVVSVVEEGSIRPVDAIAEEIWSVVSAAGDFE